MDINARFQKANRDIVTNVKEHNWRLALEALYDTAAMLKPHGKTVYLLIMENLDINLKREVDLKTMEMWLKALQNREYWMGKSVIYRL